MTLRAVVVDDEAPARAKLRRYLAECDGVRWVGEAVDGPSAVALIHKERPDVVFLDISMPGMDGFGLLQALGDPLPAEIVFVTAQDDQAVRAFEVHAFDYLLKPVGPERFARAVQRLRATVSPALGIAGRVDGLIDGAPPPAHYLERVLLPAGEGAELVRVERIDRIEADRNYLDVHVDGQSYRLRGTLDAMLGRLHPAQFVRVNRSTIVRLDAIRQIQPWPDGERRLLLVDGARVTWTKRYLANVPEGLGV
ncbi:two component transcriptional regulator, LytTR family [Luteibacter sp. UNC138MFCol5.1]|uniref:LytR/AlgR family response regulator transcription factor n=1 Tax=Luteibacter sp. UNC138MFCol5.1 TaxID=1502774 RepID=UPI0008AE049D|nr:LytTR family DNA-binding domain-containing protein [Luteibacter sp. UNC138MFCol5.1]SEO92721.1 two component transcriptional regulator, LytTR family [Luteibacter sp. UNC138MFCol5.1]